MPRANVKHSCPRCGHALTWDARVYNPRTGRYMPAHLDVMGPSKEGNVLDNGMCPEFLASRFLWSPRSTPPASSEATGVHDIAGYSALEVAFPEADPLF